MGKRKKEREANVKATAEKQKVNTINEEFVRTIYEDGVGEPKSGKLLNKHAKTKVKYVEDRKMKKLNKVLQETEHDSLIENSKIIVVNDELQEVLNKKYKKRKKALQRNEKKSKLKDEPKQQEVPCKKSKKRNKSMQQDFKVIDEVKQMAEPTKKSKKRNETSQGTENDSEVIREPKGKKIIFIDDDEPQDVASNSGKDDNTKKKKKFLNDDEAAVREEDIDNFCDELDEKDNAQYEEWVRLIESNFHSNKKNP